MQWEQKLLHRRYVDMLIDVAFLMLAFLLSIPAITGYFAYCYGRSFWGWFVIGCFFPVIAQVVLALVCHQEALKEQRRKSVFISRYEDELMHRQINDVLHQSSEKRNLS